MNCGLVRNYIERGDLIEEYFHNNGKKEGKYKIFDLKGNILVEVEYINDKKNGICKIYNPYKFLFLKSSKK
jgi:antitoxin component YwqK of YwqJK toxin-antitoxin module